MLKEATTKVVDWGGRAPEVVAVPRRKIRTIKSIVVNFADMTMMQIQDIVFGAFNSMWETYEKDINDGAVPHIQFVCNEEDMYRDDVLVMCNWIATLWAHWNSTGEVKKYDYKRPIPQKIISGYWVTESLGQYLLGHRLKIERGMITLRCQLTGDDRMSDVIII